MIDPSWVAGLGVIIFSIGLWGFAGWDESDLPWNCGMKRRVNEHQVL